MKAPLALCFPGILEALFLLLAAFHCPPGKTDLLTLRRVI